MDHQPLDAPAACSAWIRGPFTDIALIGYSWLPVYALYIFLELTIRPFECDAHTRFECPDAVKWLIGLTLLITRSHRHYSLGLAYADREVFARNRSIYLWLPLVAFLVLAPASLYRGLSPGAARGALVSFYALLIIGAALWNVYHVLMQKYGFLRIYSAKAGHGDSRVEKHLFFSWFAVVVIGTTLRYSPYAVEIIDRGPFEIGFLMHYSDYLRPLALGLLLPAMAYAGFFTVRWCREEWKRYSSRSVPKLLYAGSMALLLASFAHSALIGIVLLGFSHAFEYSVFVNKYAARRYGRSDGNARSRFLAFCARHWLLCNSLLLFVILAMYELFRLDPLRSFGVLTAYAVFSSVLHFVFDGLLWKMREPEVRKIILDL